MVNNLVDAKAEYQCILVQVNPQENSNELAALAVSAGVEVVASIQVVLQQACAKTYLSKGKVSEIQELVLTYPCVNLVIIDASLTPTQERNISLLTKTKVLDRTGLILDIFAQRAKTHEGKLQVELAQLQYLSTRLIRGWTHLERQKGGIGLRGPGETQLETDRRLIRQRIKQINKQIAKVMRQRKQMRSARAKHETPVVALVGYTNAGKSTLFNLLSNSNIYAADRLFATLDPTIRSISLPLGKEALLADTVGFIKDIPHDLIQAFHSTLQEIQDAKLLIHVVDVNAKDKHEMIAQVNKVLKIIEADHIPQLLVFNKTDLAEQHTASNENTVWISATTGWGIDKLLAKIAAYLFGELRNYQVTIPFACGKIRAYLYSHNMVVREQIQADGNSAMELTMTAHDYQKLVNSLALV